MLDSMTHIARAITDMDEPFVRYKTLLNIYGRDPGSREIRILRDEVRESTLAKTLLAEQDASGRIPLDPDDKWRGAHWVLYMLAEVGSAAGDKSLFPLRGLTLHAKVRDDADARQGADQLAEHLLAHHLYQKADGQPLSADCSALHYPCYEHCDPLLALKVMVEAGRLDDERCRDALDLVRGKQFDDGTFPAERKHYRVGRIGKGNDSLVDWGGSDKRRTNLHVTCDALGVLRAAGERF